jgi:hypothetical protein
MIIDILEILIPYFSGVIVTFLMFHPIKEWEDGYKSARERYNNWDLGFDEGYKCARKHFQNYDEGFGAGFDAGWDSALRNHEQEGG